MAEQAASEEDKAFTTYKRPCISREAGTSHVVKVGRFSTQVVFRDRNVRNQGLALVSFKSFSVEMHVARILAQFKVLCVCFHHSPSPERVSLSLSLNTDANPSSSDVSSLPSLPQVLLCHGWADWHLLWPCTHSHGLRGSGTPIPP